MERVGLKVRKIHFCKLVDISRPTLDRWIALGIVEVEEDGLIDLDTQLEAVERYRSVRKKCSLEDLKINLEGE